ncbi:endonuclease/exonuclease/phosphatase family protein [Kutzneria kofuensis]|uniref:Endonuclease/exonuclease/phosphatase (EEP) superfamily protein YafD n=1 Tax=Kutzneria kofuensis TaxID=103725 RepID=A0A7W9KGP1_9PSEU|nr:endonuclease/exonuclease/phosphatase family protein [Kutzneria kofuensis]MBB5892275.1 endonuclease/exonuclease/phosphatase (EEP) superfamily protein YafD [Kutzneria kofuensis]
MASSVRTRATRLPARLDEGRRRVGGAPLTFLLSLLTAAVIAMVALRLLGIDGDHVMVVLLAGTPYAAGGGALLVLFAMLFRRWAVAVVALAFTACLIAAVAPRAFTAPRPLGTGPAVRVLSLDLAQGRANAAAVVSLVRDQHVDVVAFQELTPESVAALNAAGLQTEMPNQLFQPGDGPVGSGIASRYPLQAVPVVVPTTFPQVTAQVSLPQGRAIQVQSVHVRPPTDDNTTDTWKRELDALPDPVDGVPPMVLAGDFNATLDHAGLRSALVSGFVDAASQAGAGLQPTWPTDGSLPPLLPIDHVLVDKRCPVDSFATFDVPGGDHKAVLTQFVTA